MKKSKLIVLVLGVLVAATCLLTNEKVFKAAELDNVTIVEGVYIGGIDVSGMTKQEATDTVNAYIDELRATTITFKGPNADLTLTYGDLGLTSNVDAAVAEAVTIAQYGNLIQRYMNQKDLEKDNVVLEMGLSIDKQLLGNLLHDNLDEFNIEAVDGTIVRENGAFTFVPGSEGHEIDIVASVNTLSQQVSTEFEYELPKAGEFTLASTVIEERGKEEDFAEVKDELGVYTTIYVSEPDRMKNVENGCSLVNGTVLFPGDELSVYELTKPYTIENGYEYGTAYADGESIPSIGGGICQVATTLYNAALLSELEITKRWNHSMTVGYGLVSGDATIAEPLKDFRFKNNTKSPIYIEGYCTGIDIVFRIYGEETRPANRTIEFEGEITSEISYAEPKFTLSEEDGLGYYHEKQGDHLGYSAVLWKYVYVDGVEVEKIKVNTSKYRAASLDAVVGVKGATPEQIALINAAIEQAKKDHNPALVSDLVGALAAGKNPTLEQVLTGTTGGATPETGNTETTTPGTDEGTTTTPGTDTGNDNNQTPETGEGTNQTPTTGN